LTLLVDTSVWSLALRRDAPALVPQMAALQEALASSAQIVTTGLILQELLQGFSGAKAQEQIIEHFAAFGLLQPDRQDHIAAARLRNTCRRAGVQIGTIDALLAQLCIRHKLTLLTTDQDFTHAALHCPLKVWTPSASTSRKR
jgi:predicted nucleic acid-binding protein